MIIQNQNEQLNVLGYKPTLGMMSNLNRKGGSLFNFPVTSNMLNLGNKSQEEKKEMTTTEIVQSFVKQNK